MKTVATAVLVISLFASNFACAEEDPIKGGTIPGTPSIGVDLLAPKSAWKDMKEHFKRNWGKYTLGLVTAGVASLVYVNNDGFHSKKKDKTPVNTTTAVNTTSTLTDHSITVTVPGSYSTVYVYSNRDSDNVSSAKE